MGLVSDFRDFIMRGNVVDLAVGVIIGAAFGAVTNSMVKDVLMPPIGKLAGNLDFSNLYISLSDKVDAANAAKAQAAGTAATTQAEGMMAGASHLLSGADRLPLADAQKLGPVIAYGNFITILINFIIVAFCVFLIVKGVSIIQKRFAKEKLAAEAATPSADVVLLSEIRDILKSKP